MILETKLNLPQPKAGALLRTGLIELVKNNLDKKLILITADAGYGKTTLLAQLVKAAKLPCMFYDLDKSDGDLLVFYSYLVNGIKQIDPVLVKYSDDLLSQGGEIARNIELMFGTLINELHEKRKEELFIILDNYHNIAEDSAVHSALDFFIDRLPEKIHVIIASRSVSPLPTIARWRAKQDLFEIEREDLAFSGQDLVALLKIAYQTVLPEEDLRQVAEHTEGWITGIQLIIQSSGKDKTTIRESLQKQSEENHPLFEYFANAILSGESKRTQDFLVRCSILDILTPQACKHILGTDDAEILLRKLEKRHAFLVVIGRNEYRYHHLFREFLLKQLKDEAMVKELHQKAANYFMDSGRTELAVDHYLEAADYHQACQAALTAADKVEIRTGFATFDHWFKQVPPQILEDYPGLLIYKATLCRGRGNLRDAENIYIQIERLISARRRKHETSDDDLCILSRTLLRHSQILWRAGHIEPILKMLGSALRNCPKENDELKMNIINLTGLAWIEKGEYGKAKTYLHQAMRLSEKHTAGGDVCVKANLAVLYYDLGEMKSAQELFNDIYDNIIKEGYFNNAGMLFANIAKSVLCAGDVERAEQCLVAGWNLCTPYEDLLSKAALYNSFGLLDIQKAEWDSAGHNFEKAHDIFTKLNWGKSVGNVLRNRAKLCQYTGNYSQAEEIIRQVMNHAKGSDVVVNVGLQRQLAQICVASGQFDKAEAILRKNTGIVRRLNLPDEMFLFALIQAAIHLYKNKRKRALNSLATAVRLSRLKGYDGMLIQELRQDPNLWSLARAGNIEPAYLGKLEQRILKSGCERLDSRDLRAHLFGPLRLVLPDGREVPIKWRSRKTTSLFAYLLVHRDRMCEREELMRALWPRADLKRAEDSLYVWIFRLKNDLATGFKKAGMLAAGLAPAISHKARSYCLAGGVRFWLDAEEFANQWRKARELDNEGKLEECLKHCRKCIDLYQDVFLCNLGEDWCEKLRDEYEKKYLWCLKKEADFYSGSQRFEEALAFYRRFLERDPFSEEVRIGLWKALKAAGRKSEIDCDYQEFKKLLAEKMDDQPARLTEEIYRQLVNNG